MDKLVIRLSAVCINLWMLASINYAFLGESIAFWDSFFGTSVITAVVITVLSFSQGKYHCKWMQSLCVNILLTQVLNIFSGLIVSDSSVIVYLIAISISWAVSTILAFYFAISHFIKVKRIKRLKNG